MKTIVNGDGTMILRVTDAVAEVSVTKGFKYTNKQAYKVQVRDARKIELEDIVKTKATQKHRSKDDRKAK